MYSSIGRPKAAVLPLPVVAVEQLRDRLSLDRRRFRVAELVQGLQQAVGQA
jgi:hypothetical protein